MKRLILTILSVITLNMGISQDVSPCYGLEIISPINGQSFFALEIDLSSIDCVSCEVDMSWQPGNVYGPSYLVFPSSIDMSFDVCCTIEISGDVNETCLICDEYVWMDTAWGSNNMVNGVQNYFFYNENDNFYYNLTGIKYKSYDEIPLGYMYIHNRKKYIKQ